MKKGVSKEVLHQLNSESLVARRREKAQTGRDLVRIEYDALRARMKNQPDEHWRRVAQTIAGLGR